MKRTLPLLLALFFVTVGFSQSYDAFQRLRVGEAQSLFDAQFTYDRQPLMFDTITQGAGTSIVYDNTNKNVQLKFIDQDSGAVVGMQSFQFMRYQPGKSQNIFITFNMNGGVSGVKKIVGYSDGTNGIEFLMDGTTPKVRIISGTDVGEQVVSQSQWNLDKLNDGPFWNRLGGRMVLDFTKTQILVIDFQALYVGRVRIGFDIDGEIYWAHQFNNANFKSEPYLQSANLPVRAYMVADQDSTNATMDLICASVLSEAGQDENFAFQFTKEGTATAGNGTNTHILSIQPRDSFENEINRSTIKITGLNCINTGANDVTYKLVLGQNVTTPTAGFVDTTYSTIQYWTGGTVSGDPEITISQGYIPSGAASSSTSFSISPNLKFPITLDHSGAQRPLGRVSLLVSGIGGTSACRCSMTWEETR